MVSKGWSVLIGAYEVWCRYVVMFYYLLKLHPSVPLSSSVQLSVFISFLLSVPANHFPSCLGKSVSDIPAAFAGHRVHLPYWLSAWFSWSMAPAGVPVATPVGNMAPLAEDEWQR